MSSRERSLDGDLARRLVTDPGSWLSCDECFRLLDVYVEAALSGPPGAEFAAMANHLDTCQACREEAETLVRLAAADFGAAAHEGVERLEQ